MRTVFAVSPWVMVSPRLLITATAQKSTGQEVVSENEENVLVIVWKALGVQIRTNELRNTECQIEWLAAIQARVAYCLVTIVKVGLAQGVGAA